MGLLRFPKSTLERVKSRTVPHCQKKANMGPRPSTSTNGLSRWALRRFSHEAADGLLQLRIDFVGYGHHVDEQ